VTRATNTRMVRTVAWATAMLVFCAFPDWAQRNHGGSGQRSAPPPRFSQPRAENRNFGSQSRQMPRQENRQQNAPQFRPAPQNQNPQFQGQRPQFQGQPNQFPQDRGGAAPQTYGTRPAPAGGNPQFNYGNNRQGFAPQPGSGTRQPYGGPHLQDWLGRNPSGSVQDHERQLHNDPSFRRLPQADQQRLTQQLRSVDRMPEQQRDRRLARNEMLERLSPEERMNINRSGREWSALPSDRQTQMRRAFQDLRNVPPDQRQTVLNSSRYQNMFSPQERGILSDFLKVEPYERPQ